MLNAAAISEMQVESSTLALFEEFLRGYFDGATHTVGVNTGVSFPRATLKFQQSALPSEGAVVGITLVLTPDADPVKRWEKVGGTRQQMAYARTRFNFWVRAELQANTGGSAKKQATDCAEKLAGLLGNAAATRPLSQRGIHRIRCGLPQPVSETAYVLRLVPGRATLRYAVRSQG